MNDTIFNILMLAFAYLMGCLNSGYYYTRFKTGGDIRKLGSGNCGATNVGRIFGKKGFLIVFLLDFSKGAIIIIIARLLSVPGVWQSWLIFATVLGHNFPIQLKAQGGKGLSSFAGGFCAAHPLIFLYNVLLLYILIILTKKKFFMSMIVVSGVGWFILLFTQDWGESSGFFAISLLIVFAHRHNFKRDNILKKEGRSFENSI